MEIRAKIEQKLSSTQSYLNSILNSLSSAVIAINEQGIISHWNIAASRMTDVPMERALGFKPIDVNPILAKCDEWISQGMINRTSISQDRIAFEVSGITKILDIRVYPLQKSGTKGVVLRLEDNSEKHKMEEIIVQTEKMMSVGGLAAGMAHEINNPLGAIMQNSQNIIRRLSPSLKRNQTTAEMIGIDLELLNHYIEQRGIFRFLDNIADAGERATLIVRNMLQFSRMGTTTKEIRDIKELIERTIQIAQSDFALKEDSNIEISQDDITSISLSCIGVEIEQVLLNIIKNSIHAIEIRQRTDSFKGQIAISVQHNAQQIQIHLKDNGIGMDRATKKRIFEPFYTTKEVGSGTGLGLSVSYFIIHSHHGGQLRVNSELNKGTEFVISLPIT